MTEPKSPLEGRRVIVFGASSGVGRATAIALAKSGARVALAARRLDRLEAVVVESGPGGLAIECDVGVEASVEGAIAQTVEAFGGLDALVYAPGIAVFEPLVNLTAETWRRVLDTNLVGPTMAMRAAIAHLHTSRGKVVLISSIVIDDRPPRSNNASYTVSKVALEALAQAWQGEHRAVGFTTIAMGDTITEFGRDADPVSIAPMVRDWVAGGYMYGRAMDVDSVVDQILSALASRETVRRIAITPRYLEDPKDGGGLG